SLAARLRTARRLNHVRTALDPNSRFSPWVQRRTTAELGRNRAGPASARSRVVGTAGNTVTRRLRKSNLPRTRAQTKVYATSNERLVSPIHQLLQLLLPGLRTLPPLRSLLLSVLAARSV